MKTIFLFTHDLHTSPMREALRYGPHRVQTHALVGGRLVCPITLQPQLVILESAPMAPVAPLLGAMGRQPTIRKVDRLVVLDPEWLSMAPRLACADFLARGFLPAEALARVDRLLGDLAPEVVAVHHHGPLEVDLHGHEARVHGARIALTPQEFALLRHLVLHAGRALSREQLLSRLWGQDYDGGTRTVDIHVRRLRQKLGPEVAMRLQTVRHVGYKWVPEGRP